MERLMQIGEKMYIKKPLNFSEAESIAISGFSYLANEPETLSKFLSVTGVSPDELRSSIGQPAFLVGILDFFLSDEKTLLEFTAKKNINPEHIDIARQLIAGPENFEG